MIPPIPLIPPKILALTPDEDLNYLMGMSTGFRIPPTYCRKRLMPKPELVLASRSPRREQILRMLGVEFTSQAPDYEEINPPGMDPA